MNPAMASTGLFMYRGKPQRTNNLDAWIDEDAPEFSCELCRSVNLDGRTTLGGDGVSQLHHWCTEISIEEMR
jgi:hypothetical protein